MTDINGYGELWPDPFGMDRAPKWVMPWLAPGPIALQALSELGTPLHACQTGTYFDPDDLNAAEHYGEDRPKRSPLERAVHAAGPRLEWRLERVWALDEESSDEDVQAYEKASKAVAGRLIHPRCLDDYVYAAWHFAEIVDIDSENNPDEDSPASRDVVSSPEFIQALEWAQAGVVVLQQSLPWPFTGVLPYSVNDNRPAHRALFAYARILYAQSPRKAKQWFRAMVYANPMDNMGARAFVNS
ncbi:hypothetical protein H7J06_26265 [Mycobacterium hodleri]|uniref:hypothetical protein n=1 Tax=Mycolicibacterium hodleri TaxID=49897 RepID=UPI0021F28D3F|nr:hypothetical protein [Mycolicibacterium hodleri]MCV7136478.1 hypothetical protein [Mycolicibacterium hodleri]